MCRGYRYQTATILRSGRSNHSKGLSPVYEFYFTLIAERGRREEEMAELAVHSTIKGKGFGGGQFNV